MDTLTVPPFPRTVPVAKDMLLIRAHYTPERIDLAHHEALAAAGKADTVPEFDRIYCAHMYALSLS